MTMTCGCVGEWLCFRHKLTYWRENGGLQLDPRATPTRRNNRPSSTENKNSWERGIAQDDRGMPILRPEDMSPMGVHEYASRRHEMDEARKKLAHPTNKDTAQ